MSCGNKQEWATCLSQEQAVYITTIFCYINFTLQIKLTEVIFFITKQNLETIVFICLWETILQYFCRCGLTIQFSWCRGIKLLTLLTLCMVSGHPKSLPPCIRNPHGVVRSDRSSFALSVRTDILPVKCPTSCKQASPERGWGPIQFRWRDPAIAMDQVFSWVPFLTTCAHDTNVDVLLHYTKCTWIRP